MTIHLYRSSRGKREWRFRIVASNGEPLASGEGYRRKVDAINAIRLIMEGAAKAAVVEGK